MTKPASWDPDELRRGFAEDVKSVIPEREQRKENGQNADAPRRVRKSALPELIINEGDPTATAKELAALIAKRNDFLFKVTHRSALRSKPITCRGRSR